MAIKTNWHQVVPVSMTTTAGGFYYHYCARATTPVDCKAVHWLALACVGEVGDVAEWVVSDLIG